VQTHDLHTYKQWRKTIFLLPLLFIVCFLLNISLGSVNISLDQVLTILLGGESDKTTWESIVLDFRLPKAVSATLVGASLGVSGLMMQTFFRNPLAGPFVLGVSSGASLGVAIVVLSGIALGGTISFFSFLGNWLIVGAAALGAFSVLLLVLLVSIKIKDSMTLLIVGLMFASATAALVSVLQFFSKAEEIQAYVIWTFGSLGGVSIPELKVFLAVSLPSLLAVFMMSKHLNVLLIGENYAQSLGMNLKQVRLWIILLTSLLAGTVTAFCGPIAFLGIAVPHLARIVFDTSNHRLLVPIVIILGASLMLACDTIAQLPGSHYTLPINAITSLLGAPVVIWIILRKRNISQSFAK